PGKTYKAKVTFADGTQNTFALQDPQSKGIVLSMQDSLDKISVQIRCNKAYLDENMNKEVSLVMYAGGTVNTVKAKLDSKILSMDLPNSQFPSGVLQATLFSQTGEPLSERLLFLKNPDLVNLSINSKKESYNKRERVSININAKDKGNDVEGHFSAAVIDESKVPFDENNETTILTYLLLTSDLSGYVEQPNYYFTHNTAQTNADLDALMLTQGYRRFAWKQLLTDMNTKFNYQPEKNLEITGIAKTASGSPVTNMDVMLLTPNSGSMLGDKTGNDGKFAFYNLPPFADNTLFTLQATGSTKTRGTTMLTVLPDKAGPAVADNKLPGLQNDVNAGMITYLSNSQAQNSSIYNNVAVRQSGDQHATQVVTGDELTGSTSLTTALNGRLNDVNFVNGLPYLKGGAAKDPMLIVIDGKIRGSYLNLDDIKPGDVGKVEVLKGSSASSYGLYGGAGVLSITSRSGASSSIIKDASYKYTSQSVVKQKDTYAERPNKDNYRSSNYGGSGHADQVVRGDVIKNATSMSQGLTGLLVGVNFINGAPYLPSNMVVTNGAMVVEPMYIILDGSPYMATGEGINDIAPNSVETVEILKGPSASIYGVNGGAGVMVITTRERIEGTQTADETALGSLAFRAKGFYKAREFYSPKYENTTQNDRRDLRSTIFWAPEVVTNKDGVASFEFYNADSPGTYRVVVEGIDEKGNVGRQVYRYKVQ
ncbi:MAG TPA: TonB-dependent receptor plug domain-containing protein, partial [Mucilaginibacter sp.]